MKKDNNDLFELITKMYSDLKGDIGEVKTRLTNVEDRLTSVEGRLTSVENTVTKIENGHGKKIDALLDGYKQNTEQLNRIEQEVAKHEEVILKRVK